MFISNFLIVYETTKNYALVSDSDSMFVVHKKGLEVWDRDDGDNTYDHDDYADWSMKYIVTKKNREIPKDWYVYLN